MLENKTQIPQLLETAVIASCGSLKELYRYVDNYYQKDWNSSNKLILETFTIVKETPKGYQIKFDWCKTKFVLKGSNGKRYAYETKEAALFSYKKRKERQILLSKVTLERANYWLSVANKMSFENECSN